MSWTIEFDKRVEKDLRALDKQAARRIRKYRSDRVAPLDDPRRLGKALTGELGEYWRYRVGPYRVIAAIQDEMLRILVVRVGHRNNAYRQGQCDHNVRSSKARSVPAISRKRLRDPPSRSEGWPPTSRSSFLQRGSNP